MSTLLKLGLSGYDVKPRFCAFLMRTSPTKSTFSLGKFFWWHRHLCEKNEPTLDRFGGGGGAW